MKDKREWWEVVVDKVREEEQAMLLNRRINGMAERQYMDEMVDAVGRYIVGFQALGWTKGMLKAETRADAQDLAAIWDAYDGLQKQRYGGG